MARKHKIRKSSILLAFVVSAALLFFVGRQERDKNSNLYSMHRVAISEVESELSFGTYGEVWKEFFQKSQKKFLDGELLEQILARLGIDAYVQYPQTAGSEPLARTEWNKIYAQILDHLDMERAVGQEQILVMDVIKAEESNVLVTNKGDFSTSLPASYFEQWSTFSVFTEGNRCLGIVEESNEEAYVSNTYLKTFSEDAITFLYGGYAYSLKVGQMDTPLTVGVCDLVFANGALRAIRTKQDKIQGALLSYDKQTIEIEGYGKISHSGKLPVYQIYGEVTEKSISDVVLGNMKAEYVTGDGEICAILISQPASIENIRVMLLSQKGETLHQDVYLSCSTQARIVCGEREEVLAAGVPVHPTDYVPPQSEDTFLLTPMEAQGRIFLCDQAGNAISNGYEGILEVRWHDTGYTLVNQLPFEAYLCAVVPSEMPSSYAPEALRAQAICARSYAYIQLLRADLAEYGAHINDSTSYQVYNKVAATDASRAAVYETAGKILTWQGQPVEAYYFSTSMGYTDTAAVWNVENPESHGYLKSVCLNEAPYEGNLSKEEDFLSYITKPTTGYDSEIKFSRWIAAADYRGKTEQINQILENRMAASAKNILNYKAEGMGELLGMSVKERSSAGTILTLSLEYEHGEVLVKTEYNIRKVLGCGIQKMVYQDGSQTGEQSMLPSASCAVSLQADGTYLLFGGGYGHGLGMSQNAANGMAKVGMKHEEILRFFYQDVKIEQIIQ
ncbi:MAG: SpoIID/LytB domain-containing protein [Clostridiales bacterium]|nr:SpoIID/LytB domain-containing protein [Clostridiales bacterium]